MHFAPFSVYAWGILGSVLAVGIEIAVKKTVISWLALLPYTLLPLLILNYCLFRLLRASDSILTAFIVFAVCNIVLRTGASLLVLHEHPSRGVWAALGLLVAAQIAKWSF